MSLEDCKTKIQQMSNLLENSNYPEQILNCRDINLKDDFQYMCLNSTVNPALVNEVIARLAQNGNKELVENNIKYINMGIWKDLFEKNKVTKEMFINNYRNIIDNTGIITYREIEKILNDTETLNLIYGDLETIIKKLCTYDRASLVCNLKDKDGGIQQIRSNIDHLFEKGEYDISTTYSKVLIELEKVDGLTRVDILESCTKYLSEMLERETAIDNETNDLLNWIYNAMEESKMYNEQRAYLQEKIDKAIMENFEGILDKTNYDKETMKILKQFSCTSEKFDNNRNMFIEKSNKLIHMTKIYDLNYEKEAKGKNNEIVVSRDFNSTNNTLDEDIKDLNTIVKFNELVKDENNNGNDIIGMLVKSNVEETDKIVHRIMNKSDNLDTCKYLSNELEEKNGKVNEEEKSFISNTREIPCVDCQPLSDNKNADGVKQISSVSDVSTEKEVHAQCDLVVADQPILIPEKNNFFMRLWKKIKKIFSRAKVYDDDF